MVIILDFSDVRARIVPVTLLLFLLCVDVAHGREDELIADPLPREAILHTVRGDGPGDWFGWTVAGMGDVNGDSIPDFAVGAMQNENWGVRPAPDAPPGYVHVYSGKSGDLLYTLHSSDGKQIDGSDDHFGAALTTIVDLDGDGAREIVVGSYLYDGGDDNPFSSDENTGGVFLFSGASGRQLKRLPGFSFGDRFGYSVATIGDMDGDGRRDLLIGVQKSDRYIFNQGYLEVLSSATYESLLRVYGPGQNAHLGIACVAVGDVDGDGVPDVAGGAFMYTHQGPAPENPGGGHRFELTENDPYREMGHAAVYSGATGLALRSWEGGTAMDHLGCSIASLGSGEIAVGASQSGWLGDFHGPGYVRVCSCVDGSVLRELSGALIGEQFGWSVTNIGDRDGDGRAELLVGAPSAVSVHKTEMVNRPGRVYLYSGSDRSLLKVVRGLEINDQFGVSAADIGDLDGDGFTEVLIGAPENDIGQTRPGYAVVVSGKFLR